MFFEVEKDTLLKAVIISDSAVSSKNTNTVLGNCHFSIQGNTLTITGTDNEIAVRNKVDIVSSSSFSFTANGKKIIQILKELPRGEVKIEVDDSFSISIKSKEVKGLYKLLGSSDEEFPVVNIINMDKSIELDQSILKDMIRNVIYAAATDLVKPSFNGVFFVCDNSKTFTSVASDSRRLSLCSRIIETGIDLKEGIIVPLKTIQEVNKILTTGKAVFSVSGTQCYFQIGKTEIISRLVDGQFPNFKQVIPKDYSLKAVVENKKIIEVLRRVMVFTKDPSYKTILSFKKNSLTIEAKTPELGEASEQINIESSSDEEITLGINAQYLMDSIKDLSSISLEICITGPMNPLTIVPEDDEKSLAVIMPIQIKNTDN
jgi:DNA polymerase-3 subunit beta